MFWKTWHIVVFLWDYCILSIHGFLFGRIYLSSLNTSLYIFVRNLSPSPDCYTISFSDFLISFFNFSCVYFPMFLLGFYLCSYLYSVLYIFISLSSFSFKYLTRWVLPVDTDSNKNISFLYMQHMFIGEMYLSIILLLFSTLSIIKLSPSLCDLRIHGFYR